jgi:hypothetical protein
MTFFSFFRLSSPGQQRKAPLAAGAVTGALSLVAIFSLAPPPPATEVQLLQAYLDTHAQALTVPGTVAPAAVVRDTYAATPGINTFVTGGTNYDWAKLVLLSAGWPLSDANVTVFVRWMRQENGPDDWWNRNNPLNNGWGSGGGGGTGSYDSLVIAAQNAAEALINNSGYSGIAAAFAASGPTEVTEQAIWASPWASGHYANGGHWSYTEVPVVKSPDGTW